MICATQVVHLIIWSARSAVEHVRGKWKIAGSIPACGFDSLVHNA